jgi:hypothetical protein
MSLKVRIETVQRPSRRNTKAAVETWKKDHSSGAPGLSAKDYARIEQNAGDSAIRLMNIGQILCYAAKERATARPGYAAWIF